MLDTDPSVLTFKTHRCALDTHSVFVISDDIDDDTDIGNAAAAVLPAETDLESAGIDNGISMHAITRFGGSAHGPFFEWTILKI